MSKNLLEFSKEHCPDYPFNENPDEGECLWAIGAKLRGTELANQDCHRMILHLGTLLGFTPDQIFKEWTKVNQSVTITGESDDH